MEVLHHGPDGSEFEAWVALFSLSEEANLPTWYSSSLLLACAAALALLARAARQNASRHHRRWGILSLALLFVSADEVMGLHERSNTLFSLGGALSFGWVILGGVASAIMLLVCLPILIDLPRPMRRRFIVAGLIYVGGALGMELPLGYWSAQVGSGDLTYALLDFVEESLEILGASFFLDTLLQQLASQGPFRFEGSANRA